MKTSATYEKNKQNFFLIHKINNAAELEPERKLDPLLVFRLEAVCNCHRIINCVTGLPGG